MLQDVFRVPSISALLKPTAAAIPVPSLPATGLIGARASIQTTLRVAVLFSVLLPSVLAELLACVPSISRPCVARVAAIRGGIPRSRPPRPRTRPLTSATADVAPGGPTSGDLLADQWGEGV